MALDRRRFMAAGLGGLAGMAAIPTSKVFALAPSRPLTRGGAPQKLIIANMTGGWDTVNVIIPHGTSEYYNRRPNIALAAPDPLDPAAALPLETGVGLHPALLPIHPLYTAGQMAVIHKVGYPQPSLSHFTSRDIMSRGLRDLSNPDSRGWLGRMGDNYFNQSLQIVGLRTGNLTDFRATSFPPVAIDSLAEFRVPGNPFDPGDSALRNSITRQILNTGGSATGLRAAVRDSNAAVFDLVDQVGAAVANYNSAVVYPNSSFGSSLQDVARMIQGQLATQVFYVTRGGFDTHSGELNSMNNSLDDLGTSLAAFQADLLAMGEWANTTICVISEFGRRNFENGSGGTDHGQALHFLLLGGSVNGGLKGPGVSNADLLQNLLVMQTDFRQVYHEIIQSRFGIDPTPLFPGYTPPGTSLNLF